MQENDLSLLPSVKTALSAWMEAAQQLALPM